jgi:membrane protein implicated in regulation of membrane protease activity
VKRLLVTVLSMEAVVALLVIVPAKTLGHVGVGTAAGVGGGIALAALLLCGFVGRGRAGLYAGSVFQALVIAAGMLLTAMYVLGVVFAALWFTGIWLGRKWERDEVTAPSRDDGPPAAGETGPVTETAAAADPSHPAA